ncbi:hypothetical protein MACH09_01660 [Vibrio sp. MACH09]|uniref:oligosaccharide flippase family protein n=1 Tax=Vibrio sp. MACH09 TaxID=3025122 RepID=UPI002791DECC|nr:oligosaccharide flippase family protein [Vibrio sp. MACH09]GLO59658.1 hypothetical protein MACH09_01660 [Vibrio sp. MACH09]
MYSYFKLLSKVGVNQVVNASISLFMMYYSARLLSPEDFGNMRYVMSIIPILMALTLPTYDGIVLSSAPNRKKISLKSVTLVRMFGGLVGSLLLIFYSVYFNSDHSLDFYLFSVVIFLPFFDTCTSYKNYLISIRLKIQALSLFLYNKLASLVIFLALSIFIYVFSIDPLWVFPLYLFSISFPTVFINLAILRRAFNKNNFKDLQVSDAIKTTFASCIATFAFSLDKILIHSNLGAEKLALYAILIMFPLEIARMIDAFFPLFYRKLISSDINKNKFLLPKLLAIIFIISLLYVVFSYPLLPLVFGEYYTYDIIVVFFSSLMIVSGSLEYYCIQKFYALSKTSLYILYSFVSLVMVYLILKVALMLDDYSYVILGLFARQFFQSMFFLKYISYLQR